MICSIFLALKKPLSGSASIFVISLIGLLQPAMRTVSIEYEAVKAELNKSAVAAMMVLIIIGLVLSSSQIRSIFRLEQLVGKIVIRVR